MSRAENPIGYFVHHQGRGHAERAAALVNELVYSRDITLFCARTDIFPKLSSGVQIIEIPSLFECSENELKPSPSSLGAHATPDTLHCAPLGWPSITKSVAQISDWFSAAEPCLFVTDVSAELGQLARIASIPHMAVLQHGERDDPGHMTSYRSAVALLAPYAERLEQYDRPSWMREKTIYAAGVGIDCDAVIDKCNARKRLGLKLDSEIVVVIGGGGGTGLPSAPLTLGARDEPDTHWVTLGKIQTEWHETPPDNLTHIGWVDNVRDWIAAADRVVSSCGNTTVHQIASAGKPWIVVPEWRYFSEQICKAEALDRAGAAAVSRHWPSSVQHWRKLWTAAHNIESVNQTELVQFDAARVAAAQISNRIDAIWSKAPVKIGTAVATGATL